MLALTYLKRGLPFVAGLLLLLVVVAGCRDNPVDVPAADLESDAADLDDMAAAKRGSIPFAESDVYFEYNLTDDDLGLQIFLDAEGWSRVGVTDPQHRKLFQLQAKGKLAQLGITELRFESAEPSPAEVLALFPPGAYTFGGVTVDRQRLRGSGDLSHDFVPAFTFSPADGAVVDPANTIITWDAPGAELVEIIIESEASDNVLDVKVEGASGELLVPPQFLDADVEYKLELLAYHENGNRSILERSFVTQE